MLFQGGYRNCRILETPRTEHKNGAFYSTETLVYEMSVDGENWTEEKRLLWRKVSTGEKAFTSWWRLGESGGATALECYVDAHLVR